VQKGAPPPPAESGGEAWPLRAAAQNAETVKSQTDVHLKQQI
jgi:hypothetical protein